MTGLPYDEKRKILSSLCGKHPFLAEYDIVKAVLKRPVDDRILKDNIRAFRAEWLKKIAKPERKDFERTLKVLLGEAELGSVDDFLKEVILVAKTAGKVIMKYYGKKHSIITKDNLTPVTEADFEANKVILEGLRRFSNYPVLSEETKDDLSRLRSDYVWFVDPLDGTKDFIRQTGDFSVIIGLACQNVPVLGVVYLPATDELYFAESGKGAYYQKDDGKAKRMSVSKVDDSSKMKAVISRSNLEPLNEEIIKGLGVKSFVKAGSVGIKAALIARRDCDLYVLTNKKSAEWDTCAPVCILKEAGGVMTDLYGRPLPFNQAQVMRLDGLVASNGKIHARIIQRIRPFLAKR